MELVGEGRERDASVGLNKRNTTAGGGPVTGKLWNWKKSKQKPDTKELKKKKEKKEKETKRRGGDGNAI